MGSQRRWLDWFNPAGEPVGRVKYLVIGFSLMLLKYAVELVAVHLTTGLGYTPLDFVSPSIASRNVFLEAGPKWLGFAWLLWTLPFVGIALVLTIRRSIDAGCSPWWGLLIFVPFLNFLAMLVGALLPSNQWESNKKEELDMHADTNKVQPDETVTSFLQATLVGVVYAFLMSVVGIYLFGDYGVMLFLGTPLVAGAASGYLLNRNRECSARFTFWHATGVVGTLFCLMVLFAFEGVICIVMAAPIILPMAWLGAILGSVIAQEQHVLESQKEQGMLGALLLLPVMGLIETQLPQPTTQMVETAIVIDATPQEVWDTVIAFPPIETNPPWYFRTGIASPQSAYIEGEGVGAVRHCQFTTGDFVEPITLWEMPKRLAFDVSDQPEPMFELTPYKEIHPPHLKGALQSKRGEFLLEALPGQKTRLIGKTWYELDMAPRSYWSLWTNWILHRVHYRVLEHIKLVTEEA